MWGVGSPTLGVGLLGLGGLGGAVFELADPHLERFQPCTGGLEAQLLHGLGGIVP